MKENKMTLKDRVTVILAVYRVKGFEIEEKAEAVRWLAEQTGAQPKQVAEVFKGMLEAGDLKEVGEFCGIKNYNLNIPAEKSR